MSREGSGTNLLGKWLPVALGLAADSVHARKRGHEVRQAGMTVAGALDAVVVGVDARCPGQPG
jgi:hypothetical protein